MYHLVARTLADEPLVLDDLDRCRLWSQVVSHTTGLVALCLMDNHLHLMVPQLERRLQRGLAAYVQAYNARWARHGALFERRPEPHVLVDAQKVRRSERYVHLNPCRARLVRCPLQWPWSTHRDAVGLTLRPARPRVREPGRYHRYVSSDPTASPDGTPWPVNLVEDIGSDEVVGMVEAAVSSLSRATLTAVRARGPLRTLVVRTLKAHSQLSNPRIAVALGMHRSSVHAVSSAVTEQTHLVWSVTGDPRFSALVEAPSGRQARRERDQWRTRPLSNPTSVRLGHG